MEPGSASGCGTSGIRIPAKSCSRYATSSRYRSWVWPPFVVSATATPASGTIRRNADWPIVVASGTDRRRAVQSYQVQPTAQLAANVVSGTLTLVVFNPATDSSGSTGFPSAGTPAAGFIRANAIELGG